MFSDKVVRGNWLELPPLFIENLIREKIAEGYT
jgi:hypothetical protein